MSDTVRTEAENQEVFQRALATLANVLPDVVTDLSASGASWEDVQTVGLWLVTAAQANLATRNCYDLWFRLDQQYNAANAAFLAQFPARGHEVTIMVPSVEEESAEPLDIPLPDLQVN